MIKISQDAALVAVANRMYDLQASKSIANTGAGKRQDGAVFERLLLTYWDRVAAFCEENGANVRVVRTGKKIKRCYHEISFEKKRLLVPATPIDAADIASHYAKNLRSTFTSKDILSQYSTMANLIANWAPNAGPYAGNNYEDQFGPKKTEFDDTVLRFEGDFLVEKVLLEYKTAKSSKGVAIDGNAHERLSFQMLQYLEIAPLFGSCTMMVFTNGAFAKYKNKYQFHFKLQMHRLANFSGFKATFNSTIPEYLTRADEMVDWLF
jgi:hypothetical protein